MDLSKLLARASDVRTRAVQADEISIRVREPSAAVHARYSSLWNTGRGDEAFATLLASCVVDELDVPCLTPVQAESLSRAPSALVSPIIEAILGLAMQQKKPDAPGVDGVPAGAAPGATAV